LDLDRLLAKLGRVDELAERATTGDRYAATLLAELLAGRGEIDRAVEILRAQADSGGEFEAGELNKFLDVHGRKDELAARAAGGDCGAAHLIANSLIAQGRTEEAIHLLRPHVATGNRDGWAGWARAWLVDQLTELGRLDEVVELIGPFAERGDWDAFARLVSAHLACNEVDQAVALLRRDAGPTGYFRDWSAHRLFTVLAEQGRFDEAMAMTDPEDRLAATTIARHLAVYGRRDDAIAHLRAHLLSPQQAAAPRESVPGRSSVTCALPAPGPRVPTDPAEDGFVLADLLSLLLEDGRVDEVAALLRARADAGSGFAAGRLAELLVEQGNTDEAIALLRTHSGDKYHSDPLCDKLLERGAIEELTELADVGNSVAHERLIRWLSRRKDLDRLAERAAMSDASAQSSLMSLLADEHRLDELLGHAAHDHYAAYLAAPLLIEAGRTEEAIVLLRRYYDGGQSGDFSKMLVNLLADLGRVDELSDEVAAGTIGAVETLERLSNREVTQQDRPARSASRQHGFAGGADRGPTNPSGAGFDGNGTRCSRSTPRPE
jgi:thioredoxin-like negative regulator of GroEL